MGRIWNSCCWGDFSLLIDSKNQYVNVISVLGVLIFLIPSILNKGFGIELSTNLYYIFGIIGVLLLVISIIVKVIKK